MKKQNFKMLLFLVAGIFGIAILAGCPSSELEGVRIENLSPWVEWSAVPQDSMQHSANPLLQWFGADRDGQVVDYQYVVLLEEDVDTFGGAAEIVSDFPDSIAWISLGNITETVVALFASEDTAEYVDQYVFLRCMDDLDAYSEIIYVFLSRNNHPPTCFVTVPEGPRWCLPDTNQFWHGINVSWEGKDSLDYEGIQPSFIWHVRLYGPFASQPDSTDTLGQYIVFVDPETGLDTLTITSGYIDDLQTGWYILYVRNFDDAHVSSVAALGFFEIYEPNWIRHPDETKDILVVNQSAYMSLYGNLPTEWEDSVRVFYEDILADAGFTEDRWDWTDDSDLPRSLLYNYRMVIVDDIDWSFSIGKDIEGDLALYLNVGGKLWINGRFCFSTITNQEGRLDYGLDDTDHPLPYPYFGISFAYFPRAELFFSEFEGARRILTDVPNLNVDTLKIQGLHRPGDFDYALPRVEYISVISDVQTLYVFDSIEPDAAGTFEGFPVAVRYETATFKTSHFSFPLFFIQYDQASEVAGLMLDWFFDDSP